MTQVSKNPKSLGSPFAPPSTKPWLIQPPALPWPFSIMAKTVFIFTRHDFGERYLTPGSLVGGSFCLGLYLLLVRLVAGHFRFNLAAPAPLGTWLTWLLFSALFLFLGSRHLFRAVQRRTMRPDEFSASDGRPWEWILKFMPIVRDEWDYELFYEPGMCICLGMLLAYFHNWFGIYLLIAGYGMYSNTSGKKSTRRALELNTLDARIQASIQPDFDVSEKIPTKPIESLVPTETQNKP